MTTIHRDDHPFSLGPRWEVTQEIAGRPELVRFVKWSAQRKLLDQVARWGETGWDSSRWVPVHPQVPRTLLGIVERHMRRGEP